MTTGSARTFGELLLRYRKAAGLTQEELAERASLSARAISDLERGVKHTPRKDTLLLLADALALSPADRVVFENIARLHARALLPARPDPAAAPPPPDPPLPRAGDFQTWPGRATPLIGRTSELAALRALLLDARVSLLTLTGPGGAGKTRLALQIAGDLAGAYADGAYCVNLAHLDEPQFVAAAIAQSLDVKEATGWGLPESLQAYLREKHVLLVLDNFEQVLDAAPLVADLLTAAPRLQVIVTSRAVLRLRGEQEFPVAPLALPDLRRLPPLAALSEYDAVRLFLARAANVRPDFALTAATAPVVAEICVRLDGLPLAIELAAARTRLLAPEALLARLSSRLEVLTGGARDLPARQQTLRGAIAWSYDLLSAAEQRLFRRLAVFAAGATLAAIAAVCNPAGDLGVAVIDGVDSLAGKSLLRPEGPAGAPGDGEPRFGMLETIREYAAERLAALADEEAATRAAFDRYYAGFLQIQTDRLRGAQASGALAAILIEIDNVRAAWQGAAIREDIGELAQGLAGLERFYDIQGWYQEGESAFARAVAAVRPLGERGGPAQALLGRLLAAQGTFSARQGRLDQAEDALRASLALLRPLRATREMGLALERLGAVVAQRGAYAEAQQYHAESLALARALRDDWATVEALNTLGLDASKVGDWAGARRHYEESLTLARALGDIRMVARMLNNLGYMLCLAGAAAEAQPLLHESLDLSLTFGDQGLVPYVIGSLGEAALGLGDYAAARDRSLTSLGLARELGDGMLVTYALLRLGRAAAAAGDAPRAEQYYLEGLRAAAEIGAAPRMLAALVGLGGLRVAAGDAERGVAMLTPALRHPATEAADCARARQLLDAAGGALGAAAFEAAQQRARAAALDALVESLIGMRVPERVAALLRAESPPAPA
jgi:predicted ATPase/transcriptional regulator with XRE-family HTH domain